MLCKSFAYDIGRYFWRVVDSIWSFVVSETKPNETSTVWLGKIVIQDTYTGSGKFTLAPSSLPPVPAFFIAFPTAAKRDQLLKTTSNLFFAPLNGFVYLCLTRSLPFTIYRVFLLNFFLFEPREIWTQLRNKQEKACSHLCYVNLLALIFCRIFSDFEHYSSKKKCYCYEWKCLRSVGVAITSRSCFRFNRVS